VFESQLLGSFVKKVVPSLTEHHGVTETQTRNCMQSQNEHATPLTAVQKFEKVSQLRECSLPNEQYTKIFC